MPVRGHRVAVVVALVVLVAAGVAVAAVRLRHGCGSAVHSLSAAASSSPFLDADQRAQQPDANRDTLVRTLEADPPPFGEVLGAVGYHYEQWAHVSAFAQGIGVRTRDNPDFTMLDDTTLQPRWSVQVRTNRSTYDASDRRYLVATMPSNSAPDLVSLDAGNGKRVWCTTLDGSTVRPDDAFATYVLDDQDVAVLRPASGEREQLLRLDGRDGSQMWQRTLDADSGDFLGDMGDGTLLVGGRPQFELLDPASVQRPAGPSLVLVSARDGRTIWTRPAGAGVGVHVLGTDPDTRTAFLQERNAATRSTRLISIDRAGHQVWSVDPAGGTTVDAALRSGRVLVRAGNRWSAYAADDGRRLWTRLVPAKPQFLPYGFQLDDVSMLDDDHALIGGTNGLHTLALATGTMTSAPLPTDGINTTYWPYEVAVSPGLIAVATNTGAVVVRRARGQ